MRKSIVAAVLTGCFIVAVAGVAFPETVTVDRALLEELLQRQTEMQQEIEALKKRLQEVESAPPPRETPAEAPAKVIEEVEYLREDTDELNDRLDVVEKRSILDRIQFDGELRFKTAYTDYDNIVTPAGVTNAYDEEVWTSRFRLNLRSNITQDLIFHGRLSYLKYWGGADYDLFVGDRTYRSVPDREGDLHVERAYVDWFFPDTPHSLTLGRMPTGDGPPYGFKNYTTRKATWPRLFSDGEYDGAMLNLRTDDWLKLDQSFFRFGYSKVIQNIEGSRNLDWDDSRVVVAAFETKLPGLDDSFFWISGMRYFDILPLVFPPEVDPEATTPKNAGYMDYYNIHLQIPDLFKTGLGWFASYTHTNIFPSETGTRMSNGYEIGLLGDNLTGSLGKNHHGYAFYTGLRYALPVGALNNPHLGFEYNTGSKHFVPYSIQGNGEIFNKLAVNGDAYEVYYIQPIYRRNMFLRGGVIYVEYDYEAHNFYFGPMVESEKRRTDSYLLMDIRF